RPATTATGSCSPRSPRASSPTSCSGRPSRPRPRRSRPRASRRAPDGGRERRRRGPLAARAARAARPRARGARRVGPRAGGARHVVARGLPGAHRRPDPRRDAAELPADAARLPPALPALARPRRRRPLHVRARAARLLGAGRARPRAQSLRPARPLRAGLRAGDPRPRAPAADLAPEAREVALRARHDERARDQRRLRALRVVGRAARRRGGGVLPRHAGRPLGHAVGHVPRARRRGRVAAAALARARPRARAPGRRVTRILLVGVGGSVGSILRYALSGLVQGAARDSLFPWGTLAVNALGCLAIGVLTELAESRGAFGVETRLLLVTGFL